MSRLKMPLGLRRGLLLSLFFCISCGKVSKQMMIANKQLFENLYAKDQRVREAAGKVDSLAKAKLEEGSIDDEIERIFSQNALMIQKNIAARDSIIRLNASNEDALKATLKSDLEGKSNIIAELKARAMDDSLTLLIIEEGMRNSTIYKIPNEIVFTGGGHKILDKNLPKMQDFFEPILDSIVTSANKYINKKLRVKIVVYGYADSDPINPQSRLYDEIAKSLYHETIDSSLLTNSPRLNQELSRLRAEEVGGLVNTMTFDKLNYITGVKSIFVDLQKEGKGEEFPDNRIKYNTIDPRRRIVKFYWKILPQ
jgi:flagellar motor protein MotB